MRSDDYEMVRPSVRRLVERDKPISLRLYKRFSMNSYEREYIFYSLSDEALLWKTENALKNCSPMRRWGLPSCYDEAIIHRCAPELAARFAEVPERIRKAVRKARLTAAIFGALACALVSGIIYMGVMAP